MSQPICSICHAPVAHLQVRSGVRVSDEELLDGHYDCVMTALGPTRALAAIRSGLLPNLAYDALTDGRLEKWRPFFMGDKRSRSLDMAMTRGHPVVQGETSTPVFAFTTEADLVSTATSPGTQEEESHG